MTPLSAMFPTTDEPMRPVSSTRRPVSPPPKPSDIGSTSPTPERLYCCPDCDEFIPEDVFHEHAGQCAGSALPLYKMSRAQLETWTGEQVFRDRDWGRQENEIERQVDEVMSSVNGYDQYGSMTFDLPRGNYLSNPTIRGAMTTYRFSTVRVQVPRGFDEDTTRAVVRRQLQEILREEQA